jgi:hypothetical protein
MARLARLLVILISISLASASLSADKGATNTSVLKHSSKENAASASTPSVSQVPQSGSSQGEPYEALLHSPSMAEQRAALIAILKNPQPFIPRIQKSLRDYPRTLRTDSQAASRAVYLSALVRDPSFPPILAKTLNHPDVQDDCEYSCPAVFALTIHACFADWKLPENLDARLTTVQDLQLEITGVSRINLKVGSVEDVARGPLVKSHWMEVEKKTEEDLIQMAGPATPSKDTRMLAALRLQTLVTGSKNRIELYLLALNDFEDASGEFRSAVYQSIYRAELARARGQ